MTQARSGRPASDVTLESLRRGELTADDVEYRSPARSGATQHESAPVAGGRG